MQKRNVWLTALVAVLVVALLAAGGFALFRLGFVRGLAASAGGAMFGGRFAGERIQPFAGHMMSGWNHPGLDVYGMHARSYGHFPAFGWLLGLLVLAGAVALVVIAINGLTRNNTNAAAIEAPKPAEPEKPASRRRAKKEE